MLAPTLAPARHRGIILLLVLAILALMALIGVTFASLAGQGRINARNFAQSVLTPRAADLMDFALEQLIADTGDVRSALRGHSLARDMFGSDAANNGYLAADPSTGAPFTITDVQPVANSAGLYDFQTSLPLPARNPTYYGYNFTRWALRLSYIGNAIPRPVDQTFEILYDNSLGDSSTAFGSGGFRVFRVSPIDATTALNNPTAAAQYGLTAWQNFLVQPQFGTARFVLDGRRLHAFNGPGLGPGALYGNFRYNGGLLAGNPGLTQAGDPGAVGMDEDYDACDLENWFLAIQSADGQVTVPSFHRPGILRYDPKNGVNDWARQNPTSSWADSAARILRPVAADGNDLATFPDLIPDPFDRQDHLRRRQRRRRPHRLGLARPGLPGPARRERTTLEAALRLPGRGPQRADPAQHRGQPRRHRRRPRRPSRQLGQRGRPHLCAAERQPGARDRRRSLQPRRVRLTALHEQHPGRQRGDRRPADPAPQPPGRHAAPVASHDVRSRGDRSQRVHQRRR